MAGEAYLGELQISRGYSCLPRLDLPSLGRFEARRAWRLMRTLATGEPSAPVPQRQKRLRIPAGLKSLLRRVPSDVWTAAAGSAG